MKYMKQVWQYLLAEPFTWIFYCFFQPTKFEKEFEIKTFSKRIIPLLRLALPIFICSYPFAVIIQIILYQLFPPASTLVLSCPNKFFIPVSNVACFSLITAETTVLGIIGGIAFGIAVGMARGIAFSIAVAIARGIAAGIIVNILLSITKGIIVGITVGIILGIAWGITRNITFSNLISIAIGIIAGIALGIMWGVARGITFGVAVGIVGNIAFGIAGSVAVGIVLAIPWGIIGGIVVRITRGIIGNIAVGITESMRLGIAAGLASGLTGTIGVIVSVQPIGNRIGISSIDISQGLEVGIAGGIASIIGYIIGYYRLPLYPISSFSTLKAYFASLINRQQVFMDLQRSSLHWDEHVFLPLPGLKGALRIAAEQDAERALKEINFVIAERPQQIKAVWVPSLEIAIRHLEKCEDILDIAKASHWLAKVLPQEARLINPQWITPFDHLKDASSNAARYCSPLSRKSRREALEDLIADLEKVYPNTASEDAQLNNRLADIVAKWLDIANPEREKLEKVSQELGQIHNPYIAGLALEPRASLFVGRRDLAQRLDNALSKGNNRPTFFLNGERRMGKSSTLNQLPHLLGARYFPIIYDLQDRGISASTAAFLGTLSEEIHNEMQMRGIQVKKLKYAYIHEVSKENEAETYRLFNDWFKEIEYILTQENRTLLLAFDEFEKLEEAEQGGYLDLRLLLDWFRSVIEHHPRLALLFSGVHTLGEMGAKTGINWAGYFVNVQSLKVSFLRPTEAYQLITQPVPDFPSEQIFSEGVAEEIMRVTGCHPFLVQAVCSAMIDNLNADKRNLAKAQDVAIAVNQVLENWEDTYFRDLWKRTDQDQRMCLFAIRSLGVGDIETIERKSGLDERTVHRTMQTLLKRDLISQENGIYRIATPIFSEWVERNKYN